MMKKMMLMQIYTTFLGLFLIGLVEDFMVSLVEASKCLQVENIISCCGECVGIPPRLEC